MGAFVLRGLPFGVDNRASDSLKLLFSFPLALWVPPDSNLAC